MGGKQFKELIGKYAIRKEALFKDRAWGNVFCIKPIFIVSESLYINGEMKKKSPQIADIFVREFLGEEKKVL